MAWQLPLYELALMTAGRAYDMNIELPITIITPEDTPLAIFGTAASSAIAARLARAHIETINSAYVEIPNAGEVVINPGDRRMHVQRVVALPELYGPSIRGIPLGEHGFIRVDPYGRVRDVEGIYAAGDAIDFPIKHGGLGSQQADAAALSIASLAGANVVPEPFNPVIRGMLLTDDRADVPDGEDHRRARIQLGDLGHADVAFRAQDRREVPRAVPGSTRPRRRAGPMSTVGADRQRRALPGRRV